MVSYYASSSDPAQVRGKTVYIQYSNRHEIVNNKSPGDNPGNVLLVTIEGVEAGDVSIDVIHLVIAFLSFFFLFNCFSTFLFLLIYFNFNLVKCAEIMIIRFFFPFPFWGGGASRLLISYCHVVLPEASGCGNGF